ncbi:hypothetical protein [Wolbachia endosymbiont of Mansonella perstans]|uniref:hypothetical protein n=1 Tax=Wolbachia endosymbiont of Mansonella perstans TaxID=229526 RepID=UPI001CE1741E|nr:hypothetical protein [Wolbachia endosymbiont of Mansonella perstans]MCA4774203.1 hypothetical protein [Wolbachia endosymbiont of Mansonella perstans]
MSVKVKDEQPYIKNVFDLWDPFEGLRPKVPSDLLDGKTSHNYQAEGDGSQWNPRLKRKLESDIIDGGSNPQKRPSMDGDWPTVSDDQQTFSNTCSVRSESDNYTGRSCNQEIPDSTSKCSTETEEDVGENVNDGWGLWNVNQATDWPNESGKVIGTNSEECSLPSDINSDYGSWGPLQNDDSMSDHPSESTDSSDSDSEGDSSSSLDYFSLLEFLRKSSQLAEIPLTEDEKELIKDFYEKIKDIREKNDQEDRKSLYNQSINCTRNALKRIKDLVDNLPQEIRLNSLCDDCENTVSGLVIETVLDTLGRVPVVTFSTIMHFGLDGPCESALDDPDSIKAVVDIVRKLIVNGGRIKLKPHSYDEDERLCRMIGGDMISEFTEKREQIYAALKRAAYGGIVNKDIQVQRDNLVVDVDNFYFYTKYPQGSTIEVAKVVNGLKKAVNDLKKVTNDLKIEELNFKYYVFRIGESIVRFEEDKDEKRNYTDVLQGGIEMSFTTKAGKISIHLYPSSTETKDGKTENKGIKVEIDEENKIRFFQLEDEEKKNLGKNYLLEGKSVADVIAKSLEKNGDVPTSSAKALSNPITYMEQIFLDRPRKADIRSM